MTVAETAWIAFVGLVLAVLLSAAICLLSVAVYVWL